MTWFCYLVLVIGALQAGKNEEKSSQFFYGKPEQQQKGAYCHFERVEALVSL